MQIKKALTSIFIAASFLLSGTGALAAVTGSTSVGGVCGTCPTGSITCPTVCPGISNSTTGPDSLNKNLVEINQDSNVVVENNACATDDLMFNVDTGIGTVSSNTVVGDLSGGDVVGNVSIAHDLNSASISMPGAQASVVGPVSLANAITGPNSTNINKVRINDRSNTSISNNANYSGNYNFDINTGNSSIGNNTVVGNVSTGDVSLGLTENVRLNRNSNITIPAQTAITVPNMSNSITGPSSTNLNTYELNRERNIDISNDANITNNVNANINTGNNTIEGNTCVGNVSTGDVRFNVSVSASAN